MGKQGVTGKILGIITHFFAEKLEEKKLSLNYSQYPLLSRARVKTHNMITFDFHIFQNKYPQKTPIVATVLLQAVRLL